jgi:hypothetical protein
VAPPSSANETFLAQLLEGLDSLSTPVVLILVTLGEDRSNESSGRRESLAGLHLAAGDPGRQRSPRRAPSDAVRRPHRGGSATVLHYLAQA